MATTMMERDRDDTTLVSVGGAGLVPWNVLAWLRSVEFFGVRFRVVGEHLEVMEAGQFACIGGLPPPALEFLADHGDALRRVLKATSDRVM